MDFLADENVEPITIAWLRSMGHNVFVVSDTAPGSEDNAVLKQANDENRIVVTYDLDFGEMVFRQKLSHAGIILLRLSDPAPADRLAKLQRQWPAILTRCMGRFVVVDDQKIRARPI